MRALLFGLSARIVLTAVFSVLGSSYLATQPEHRGPALKGSIITQNRGGRFRAMTLIILKSMAS